MRHYWLSLLLIGCASSRLVTLPDALQADRYSVAGRVTLLQPKPSFGPYKLSSAHIYSSGDHRDASIFNGQVEKDTTFHHGKFELKTASGTFHAKCERAIATVIQHDKSLGYRSENGRGGFVIDDEQHAVSAYIYGCAIAQPKGADLRLTLRSAGEGVIDGGVRWTVGTLEQESPPIAEGLHSGYVIREGDDVLGVVDISEQTTSVTFPRALEGARRDQVASAAASLLLLRDMY